MSILDTAITVLGVIALCKCVLLVCCAVWSLFRPSKVKSYGGWAVVTGSTDGIGLAYVRQFAKKGINVVLISRSQDKLDECKAKLSQDFSGVEFRTIQADFNVDTPETYQRIERDLKNIDVGILVNNVGKSYDYAEYFDQVTDELVESLIRINIMSCTRMTRMVLPAMLARGRGAVVNVGSASGSLYTGSPLYAVYSATKAYVDMFSRSLHLEYKSKGVSVQCQIPYFVTTKMSKIRSASFLVPNPDGYAAAAVRNIGYEGFNVPFPAHAVQHWVFERLPGFLFKQRLLDYHAAIRRAAYKKKGLSEPKKTK